MGLALLVVLSLATLPAGAEPVGEGSLLAGRTMEDQHGQTHRIDESVGAILFSRDMDGGGILKDALAESGALLLADARAVYVADVSGMPGLIRRLVALPRLRRRDYPVLLDLDGSKTGDLPSEEARGTLVVLQSLRIASVQSFASAGELRNALLALKREQSPDADP